MLELDEFSGLKPQVLDCVTLLYGGAVIPTVDNIQAIMKFSVLYEVCDLYEISVNWARLVVPFMPFCKLFTIFSPLLRS